MCMDERYMNKPAEEMRLRCVYRRLGMTGRLHLPVKSLAPLIGPDCAYRLSGVGEATRKGQHHDAR